MMDIDRGDSDMVGGWVDDGDIEAEEMTIGLDLAAAEAERVSKREDKEPYVVIDCETTGNGTNPHYGKLWPFDPANKIVCLAWEYPEGEPIANHSCPGKVAKNLLEGSRCIVGHNIGYDVAYLLRDKEFFKAVMSRDKPLLVWDTQIAEYLITGQEHKYSSLAELVTKYLGDTLGKGEVIPAMWEAGIKTEDIPIDIVENHCKQDVALTHRVFLAQLEVLESLGLKDLAGDMMKARSATLMMEEFGVAVKLPLIVKCIENYEDLYTHTIEHIRMCLEGYLPGFPIKQFNPESNKHVSALIYGGDIDYIEEEHIGKYKTGPKAGTDKYRKVKHTCTVPESNLYPQIEATPTRIPGVYSVTDEIIKEILSDTTEITPHTEHWEDGLLLILKLRGLKKELTTYLRPYKEMAIHNGDGSGIGFIHAQYQHTATGTGRLSCRNPNLQNLTVNE